MPGVLSARWSGRHGDDPANTALLLAQLGDVPDERRGAAFVSACALVSGGCARSWCAGCGRAASCGSRAGDGGFGYDPVFLPSGSSRTAAELSPARRMRCRIAAGRWRLLAAGAAGVWLEQAEPLPDVVGLEVLDDDADERDGAGQQHADGLARSASAP